MDSEWDWADHVGRIVQRLIRLNNNNNMAVFEALDTPFTENDGAPQEFHSSTPLSLLRSLSYHFAGLRTLIRYIQQCRRYGQWLQKSNSLKMEIGAMKSRAELRYSMPGALLKKTGFSVATIKRSDDTEEAVLHVIAPRMKTFRSKMADFDKYACASCEAYFDEKDVSYFYFFRQNRK